MSRDLRNMRAVEVFQELLDLGEHRAATASPDLPLAEFLRRVRLYPGRVGQGAEERLFKRLAWAKVEDEKRLEALIDQLVTTLTEKA